MNAPCLPQGNGEIPVQRDLLVDKRGGNLEVASLDRVIHDDESKRRIVDEVRIEIQKEQRRIRVFQRRGVHDGGHGILVKQLGVGALFQQKTDRFPGILIGTCGVHERCAFHFIACVDVRAFADQQLHRLDIAETCSFHKRRAPERAVRLQIDRILQQCDQGVRIPLACGDVKRRIAFEVRGIDIRASFDQITDVERFVGYRRHENRRHAFGVARIDVGAGGKSRLVFLLPGIAERMNQQGVALREFRLGRTSCEKKHGSGKKNCAG